MSSKSCGAKWQADPLEMAKMGLSSLFTLGLIKVIGDIGEQALEGSKLAKFVKPVMGAGAVFAGMELVPDASIGLGVATGGGIAATVYGAKAIDVPKVAEYLGFSGDDDESVIINLKDPAQMREVAEALMQRGGNERRQLPQQPSMGGDITEMSQEFAGDNEVTNLAQEFAGDEYDEEEMFQTA